MFELYKDEGLHPIKELQFFLREIALHNPEIPRLVIDGIYEPHTRQAIIEFQKINALPVTGITDLKTWNKVVAEYKKCREINDEPNKVTVFTSKCFEIKQGDEQDCVYVIQILLNNLAKKYKNYNTISITGKFDQETEESVKAFQKTNSLPITGTVDKKTWNLLTSINNICRLS